MPREGTVERATLLHTLLDLDRDAAEAEVVAGAKRQRARDERPWLDLLVRCRSEPGQALLRTVLATPDYELSMHRYRHSPVAGVRRERGTDSMGRLRDLLEARVATPGNGLHGYLAWLGLYLAVDGDLSPARPALRHWLTASATDRRDIEALVRILEKRLGRVTEWTFPTEAELRKAASQLGSRLR
jgi:hypothetical protein